MPTFARTAALFDGLDDEELVIQTKSGLVGVRGVWLSASDSVWLVPVVPVHAAWAHAGISDKGMNSLIDLDGW